jgi:hypothetical protein
LACFSSISTFGQPQDVAAFGLEYFILSDNDTCLHCFESLSENIFIGLRVLNLRKMDDFGTDIKILFRYQNLCTYRTLIVSSLIWFTSYKWGLFLWPAWLDRRKHLPVFMIYYPATILAKHKVSVARIPIMQAKKFTIYSKHSMPTRQHEFAFRVDESSVSKILFYFKIRFSFSNIIYFI